MVIRTMSQLPAAVFVQDDDLLEISQAVDSRY